MNYRRCNYTKMGLQRRKVLNADPRAPSGRHFTSKTDPPSKSYAPASENRTLKAAPADTHRHKNTAEQAADKWTDSEAVTLITTVQQIMTGLQRVDTEEDRFVVMTRAVYGLVVRKQGSESALPLSDPSSPQAGCNSTIHQEVCDRCHLNLVMNPHRTRCHDHTGLLRDVAVMQPVPISDCSCWLVP
jgi:hypothetical protein